MEIRLCAVDVIVLCGCIGYVVVSRSVGDVVQVKVVQV